MGLFDEIYFDKSPIKDDSEAVSYQTKSFGDEGLGGTLSKFRITEDGRLQYEETKTRDAKPEEQSTIGKGDKAFKLPIFVVEHVAWRNDDFNGEIYCYGNGYDISMVFVYGKLDNIKVEKDEIN